jgi:L-2-hydroxyglutarate oxidase LhgO
MEAYAARHAIPVEHCGKLVVALDGSELPRFEALKERAMANGVPGLEDIGPRRIAGSSRTPPAFRRSGVRHRSSTSVAWP